MATGTGKPSFSEQKKPFLLISPALNGRHMIAGSFDLGSEPVFLQRLLRYDFCSPPGMGGGDLFHRKCPVHSRIDMGLAHPAGHAFDFQYCFYHC